MLFQSQQIYLLYLEYKMARRNADESALRRGLLNVLHNLDNGMDPVAGFCNESAELCFVDGIDLWQSIETNHEHLDLIFGDLKVAIDIGANDGGQDVLHDIHEKGLLDLALYNTVLFDKVNKVRHRRALAAYNVFQASLGVPDALGLGFQIRHLHIQIIVLFLQSVDFCAQVVVDLSQGCTTNKMHEFACDSARQQNCSSQPTYWLVC